MSSEKTGMFSMSFMSWQELPTYKFQQVTDWFQTLTIHSSAQPVSKSIKAMMRDLQYNKAYFEAHAGSNEEANAEAIKQHTVELLLWVNGRAKVMRTLMSRALPAVEDDVPPSEKDAEAVTATIH